MKEIMILFLLVVAQNASFTLVSRARNSNSLLYHTLAAIGSNGIWLLVFRNMVVSINDVTLMCTYLVASVLGSIGMHYLAMKYFEKKKEIKPQVPTIGRIVNYIDVDSNRIYAAIITEVWNETCVNINVFMDTKGVIPFTSVINGSNKGNWNWPEIKK